MSDRGQRRIALVHTHAWPDVRRGGERYLDDLTTYLRGAGHVVDTVTGAASTARASDGHDVRLRHLPSVQRGRLRLEESETFAVRAFPTLVRKRYDVVHALTPTTAIAAKLAGHRVVFTLLGHPTPALLSRRRAQRRLLKAAVRAADAVTVLSQKVARDVERSLGRRAHVVPPGVRLDAFSPAPERHVAPTILFASAMRPEKGLVTLLQAFGALHRHRSDVQLILSGPGDPAWAFEAARDHLADAVDRVHVAGVGAPGDLARQYAMAHATVLPSRNEAFGLVLVESLASGTPVVGCYGGGAEDIVTDEVGALVAHGDAEALASAIDDVLSLARSPSTASSCVERAATWDWNARVGPAHEAVYELVIRHAESRR